jgi:murein DD-endopeptidase MepM/ murein hydrolase activator NlpD
MKRRSIRLLAPVVIAGFAAIPSSAAVPERLDPNVGSYSNRAAHRESTAARLDKAAAHLDAGERQAKQQFEDLQRDGRDTRARLIARGHAYVRWTRAGLLPLSGGFEQFLLRASRLERLHRSLAHDIKHEQQIEKSIVALGKRIETLSHDRSTLELRRNSAHKADVEEDDVQERALAFERAFASPPNDGHTAIYGANLPLSADKDVSDFRKLKGHMAFPVAGRAEIVRARRRGGGGPGLEMRVSKGASVQAVFGGRVAFADQYADFGNTVIVDHGNNYFTVNAGLASMRVKLGEEITSGATLGTVGDTGLYFEIRRSGDTVDPAPWFGI